jgi:sugar phosphate isomerase/epimerase
MERRDFLKAGTAGIAGLGLPSAAAAGGAQAAPGYRYRLALAAYSMRKYLDLKNPTMTLEQFIDKTAEWGFDGAELTEYFFAKPISGEYVSKLKRAMLRNGLAVTGTPIGNTFTHPAGEARDREITKAKQWIDVSADVGSPAIRIFAGNTPKGTEEGVARKYAVECIESCLPHAAKRGVVLALENHGGVVSTADGMLEILKALKSDWLGANVDTGNFHVPDPYAELEKIMPYAATCQVKVEMSVGGKKTEADIPRLIAMFRKHAYRGFVTLEYEAAEEPLQAIPRYLEQLRKAVEKA